MAYVEEFKSTFVDISEKYYWNPGGQSQTFKNIIICEEIRQKVKEKIERFLKHFEKKNQYFIFKKTFNHQKESFKI